MPAWGPYEVLGRGSRGELKTCLQMLGLARVLHLPQSDCLRVPEGTKTSAPQTQPKPRATGHQRAWPVGRRCLSRMKRPASRSHGGGRVEPAASALGKDQPV